MAHTLETMEGLDIRIIEATVRGWILARTLTGHLTAARARHELGLTDRQARLGLAKANEAALTFAEGAAPCGNARSP